MAVLIWSWNIFSEKRFRKYKKSRDVSEIESEVYEQDMRDLVDIMLQTAKDTAYGVESAPGKRRD